MVRSEYLAEPSNPQEKRYVFAYHIRISNEGRRTARLLTRHWIIMDGDAHVEEVRGDGVVGQQPSIAPGETYERAFGKMEDGLIYHPATCSHCLDIRRFVQNSVPCFCWSHGSMEDDAVEAVQAAYDRARDEVKGLAFGLGRLIVKRKRASRTLRRQA